MDEKLEEHYKKTMKGLDELFDFYGKNHKVPISFSQVSNKESLDKTLNCVAVMKEYNVYRGEKIGIVNPELPNFMNSSILRRGRVVLYHKEKDHTLTVQQTYSPEFVAKEIAKGSLNFTHTIINVPLEYIVPLVPNKVNIFRLK